MNYIYFDIECCDGKHICSFGYVVVDEEFNVLEKKDLVINPEKPFRLGRDGFDPRIHLAYQEQTFYKQKNFKHFYPIIKNLLMEKGYTILGHGITADIQYLKTACYNYGFAPFDIKVYDTQDFYYQLNQKYKTRSLENIIKDLGLDVSNLQEHKSCDDAEMSMLVAKEICKRLNVSITDLLELCECSIKDGGIKQLSEKGKKKRFAKDVRAICEKYPDRNNWKSICLSDTIVNSDYENCIQIIKAMLKKGYNHTSATSQCDFFVMGNGYGERDLSCDYNIKEFGKQIKKITIQELYQMLEVSADKLKKDEKYKQQQEAQSQENSEISLALKEALAKKGITYQEYLNSFSNDD